MTEWQQALQELKGLRDEIRLKIHLAGKDLRAKWGEIEPQVDDIEQQLVQQRGRIERKAEAAFQELGKEVRDIAAKLRARLAD